MKFKINKQADKQAVIEYIGKLPDGKDFTVDITRKRTQRTLSQNALYWLWVTCTADETGNDKDIIHSEFGHMFLPKKSGKLAGKLLETPVSTTTLDTAQFKEYLDKIQVFSASELGIILPDPEDLAFQSFYETYKDRL